MLIIILLTQRPLLNWLRTDGKHDYGSFTDGGGPARGLIAGARNMIGIGIATATAGIIVGGRLPRPASAWYWRIWWSSLHG